MTNQRYPSSFDKEALLRCSRGELFGEGNAQLPAPNMLMAVNAASQLPLAVIQVDHCQFA